MGPCRRKHPVAGGQVEEVYGRRVDVNAECVLQQIIAVSVIDLTRIAVEYLP